MFTLIAGDSMMRPLNPNAYYVDKTGNIKNYHSPRHFCCLIRKPNDLKTITIPGLSFKNIKYKKLRQKNGTHVPFSKSVDNYIQQKDFDGTLCICVGTNDSELFRDNAIKNYLNKMAEFLNSLEFATNISTLIICTVTAPKKDSPWIVRAKTNFNINLWNSFYAGRLNFQSQFNHIIKTYPLNLVRQVDLSRIPFWLYCEQERRRGRNPTHLNRLEFHRIIDQIRNIRTLASIKSKFN